MIEGILGAASARHHEPSFSYLEGRRDLISSARIARQRGLIPVIAEIKPRVLSRPLSEGEAAARAALYQQMGACAVSVLTEPTYFLGSLEWLDEVRPAVSLPVLRKDFITDFGQVREGQADLILLIASLLPDLQGMMDAVRSAGMEPLVEVHFQEELTRALRADASIIGINNRDLSTLEVDLSTFERLSPLAMDAGAFLVAESGVQCPDDACRMVQAGADAILVGTALMKNPRILASLTGLEVH